MKQSVFFFFLLISAGTMAQPAQLTPAAALLFQNTKSSLSVQEKNQLVKQLGFLLSTDKKQFIIDREAADFPFPAFVLPTDLNGDGVEEIFVSFGNSYTSGHTGQSIVLFIKDATGRYRQQLGFPGIVPDALPAAAGRYPDLVIGGPGFEFPVWRWNGKEYDYHRAIKDEELSSAKRINIEQLSKDYMATLKQ